jgi:hypothetical protein
MMATKQFCAGNAAASATCTFENWYLNEFFTKLEDKGLNITVLCNLCKPKGKQLSTAKSSVSNLQTHLKVSTLVTTRLLLLVYLLVTGE